MDGKGLISNDKGLAYLATPYSHTDPQVMEARFKIACRIAGSLFLQGWFVYSPIVHTHPIGTETKLPTGWEYWKTFDSIMLNRCNCLIVATMPGWKESIGLQAELELARHWGKTILWCDDCGNFTKEPV